MIRQTSTRLLAAIGLLAAGALHAASYDFIGSGATWPDEADWVAIEGANDPDDGLSHEQLDFVGDSTHPMAYSYDNGQYVYFRMRLDVGSVVTPDQQQPTFHDSHLVLIDVPGQRYDPDASGLASGDDDYPDYGFAWDSKSNDPTKHGLEMQVRDVTDNVWNGINMDDIDLQSGQKLSNDINGGNRTGDGYVRAIWGTPETDTGTSFGTTTFLDFAVSWSYLTTYTDLSQDQEWNVVFATISDATDHNNIDADVSGGAAITDPSTDGWTPVTPAAPLPPTLALLLIGLGALWRRERRHRR